MKVPKKSSQKATQLAPEHPIYMAEGGEVESVKTVEKKTAAYPKGFKPENMHHYLKPGEKPYTSEQLMSLGYTSGKSDNEYVDQDGNYMFYKPVAPNTASYNTPDNPYYVAPVQATQQTQPVHIDPKYPTVGTPEWDAQRALIDQRKKEGYYGETNKPAGMKKGGGIQKLVTGGTIDDDSTIITGKKRSYKHGIYDYAHDVVLGSVDGALGGVGLENVVKEKDYNTKLGGKYNGLMYGVNKIGSSVNNQVVNYFVPGLGTAIGGVKKSYAGVGGADEGLNAKDKATQDKVAAGIDSFGGMFSGLKGKGKKGGESNTETPAVAPVETGLTSNTSTPSVQDNSPATVNNGTGNYSNMEYDEFGNTIKDSGMKRGGGIRGYINGGEVDDDKVVRRSPNGDYKRTIYADGDMKARRTLKGVLLDDAPKPTEEGHFNGTKNYRAEKMRKQRATHGDEYFGRNPLLAKGGQIVGPGTGTSDSISAKVEDGGFIVPAKNAKIAEQIRAEHLGDPANRKAPLKSGDTNVKLSDGEHYFTASEKALLISKGINLDALAPDADVSATGKADGGDIEDETDKRIKELEAKRKKAEKDGTAKTELKKIDDEIEKVRQSNATTWAKNKSARLEKRDSLKKNLLDVEKETIKLDNAFKNYQKVKADKNASPAEKLAAIQSVTGPGKSNIDVEGSYLEQAKKYRAQVKDILNEKMYYDNDKNYDPVTHEDLKSIKKDNTSATTDTKKVAYDPTNVTPEVTKPTATPVTGSGTKTSPKGGLKSVTDWSKIKIPTDTTATDNVTDEPLPQAKTPVTNPLTPAQTPEEKKLETDAIKATTPVSPLAKRKERGDGVGMERGFALVQAGLGMEQLLADGKRPVDSIDPDFERAVQDAKTEATFGISPLEREIADKNIERNRRAGVSTIMGLSGGSAGTALANVTANNMAASDATSNLSLDSEKLRLQKKMYADSLVGRKADMKRSLFKDKLEAFEQDQMAGANLVSSGIGNYIGSMRYDKQLAANKEADSYKPTFNLG